MISYRSCIVEAQNEFQVRHLFEVMGASNPLHLGWGRIAPTKSYERKP
jgi:hypothetical protein